MDYDLTRLGPREFENLAQALALKVLGPGVTVFGDGPDGGREAIYEGRASLGTEDGNAWDGYIVLQAKFRTRLKGAAADARWLLEQLNRELGRWDAHNSIRSKARRPDYLIVVTNVVLSAVQTTGGIDVVGAFLRGRCEQLGIRRWTVWHHDQVCRLLDGHEDIRRAYAGLVTPGDVLSVLHEVLSGFAPDVGAALTRHAAKELLADQWVRLGEAGDPTNTRLPLGSVAVDLRGADQQHAERDPVDVAAHIIGRGDTVLRPSAVANSRRHVVIVGGPGQGKTTLSQLLCQAYRVALLAGVADSLGPDADALLASLRAHLQSLGLPTPSCRRWPVRVELADYAEATLGGEDVGLLRYIAHRISARGSDTVHPSQLRGWLGSWPWLLVLDGLDEVAAVGSRDRVMAALSDFLVEAGTVDADLLVVGTTRPQGYDGDFPVNRYKHLRLLPLEPAEAVAYAKRLADVRHRDDTHTANQVVARIEVAAQEELTARLMRSPLQVTIMALLLERRQRAPQDRHGLFDAYYETIYAREASKPGPTAQLLDQHRNHVTALHEHVGLRVHLLAEEDGDPAALLSAAELKALAVRRLANEGYVESEAVVLADRLVAAATTRLVLLVPKGTDHVGFEIRSLQEFMAARALVDGPPEVVLRRLEVLLPAAHWRNTWLFAAGRLFARAEHMRDGVVGLLGKADVSELLATLWCPGAQLAVDLLDDDLAANSPQFQRVLVERAVTLIDAAVPYDAYALARVLLRLATKDKVMRAIVEGAIDRAVLSTPYHRLVAREILTEWEQEVGPVAARARQRLGSLPPAASAAAYVEDALAPEGVSLAAMTAVRRAIDISGLDDEGRSRLDALFTSRSRTERTAWQRAFELPAVRDAVAVAIDQIRPGDWMTANGLVRAWAGTWFNRQRVGPMLSALEG